MALEKSIISGPVIAAGQSLSSVLNCSTGNAGVVRIIMPFAWTPAWLTFQISEDGTTFYDLAWPNGVPVVVTVTPGAAAVTQTDVWGSAYFKFRSGTATAPIPQLETRNFTVIMK